MAQRRRGIHHPPCFDLFFCELRRERRQNTGEVLTLDSADILHGFCASLCSTGVLMFRHDHATNASAVYLVQ